MRYCLCVVFPSNDKYMLLGAGLDSQEWWAARTFDSLDEARRKAEILTMHGTPVIISIQEDGDCQLVELVTPPSK